MSFNQDGTGCIKEIRSFLRAITASRLKSAGGKAQPVIAAGDYFFLFRQEIERLDTYGFAESIDFHEILLCRSS